MAALSGGVTGILPGLLGAVGPPHESPQSSPSKAATSALAQAPGTAAGSGSGSRASIIPGNCNSLGVNWLELHSLEVHSLEIHSLEVQSLELHSLEFHSLDVNSLELLAHWLQPRAFRCFNSASLATEARNNDGGTKTLVTEALALELRLLVVSEWSPQRSANLVLHGN